MAKVIDFLIYKKRKKLFLCKASRKPKIKIIRRRRETFYRAEKQGSLDSLCGIYSIINAISLTCKLRRSEKYKLFKKLIRELARRESTASVTLHGTSDRKLQQLLNLAIRYINKKHHIDLVAGRIFRKGSKITLNDYWRAVQEFMGEEHEKRSIIIGMEGRYSHWTCIHNITPTQINLFDSGHCRILYRKSCRVQKGSSKHHILCPSTTFGISRKG